jgi:hypothetical protein
MPTSVDLIAYIFHSFFVEVLHMPFPSMSTVVLCDDASNVEKKF